MANNETNPNSVNITENTNNNIRATRSEQNSVRNRRATENRDSSRHRSSSRERRARRAELREQQELELEIKHKAADVVSLIIPVSICMLCTVIIIKNVHVAETFTHMPTLYAPYIESNTASGSKQAMTAIVNSLFFACFVCIMTFGLYFMFKYKCMIVLHIWIAFTFFMCMFMITGKLAVDAITEYNLGIDYFTFGILLWNFGVVGVISLLWKAPKKLNQTFSVILGILMATTFIQVLPEWTGWAILFVISVWDLIAVLCPYGPLRMLVETAHERGDRNILPGIIYSAMAYEQPTEATEIEQSEVHETSQTDEATPINQAPTVTNQPTNSSSGPSSSAPTSRTTSNETNPVTEDDDEDSGVKLGLGDFIFYSLLVAKAAIKTDWVVTFACYISILLGLCATLVLLAITKHALPALPISIFLGLIAYFTGQYLVKPFLDQIVLNGIML